MICNIKVPISPLSNTESTLEVPKLQNCCTSSSCCTISQELKNNIKTTVVVVWATERPCNLGELIRRQLVCKPRGTSWKGEDATCCTSTEKLHKPTYKNRERRDLTLGKVRLHRVGRRHAECERELHFIIPVYSELEICLYQNRLKWFWILKTSVIENRLSVMQGCHWKEQIHASKPRREACNPKSVREIPTAEKYFLPKGTVILKLGSISSQIMRRGHHWDSSSNPPRCDSPCKGHSARNLSNFLSFLQKTRQVLSSPLIYIHFIHMKNLLLNSRMSSFTWVLYFLWELSLNNFLLLSI